MIKILLVTIFLSFQALAQPLCERFQKGIVSYLELTESRISFKNQGGLLNGGVCWWHGRLQRSSALLAEFHPEKDRPSVQQLKIIFQQLKNMNSVVIIPGFSDFNSFTQQYEREVQSFLESWQRSDGFINQEWIRGISGKSELEPKLMQERMSTLFGQFNNSPHPIWVMIQMKGITSHALVVLDMRQTDEGFELKTIDSNYPLQTRIFNYKVGNKSLFYGSRNEPFVPYLGFQKDLVASLKTIKEYCKIEFDKAKDIPMGEIELGPKAQ